MYAIKRLIKFTAITVVLVYVTTFGWRFWGGNLSLSSKGTPLSVELKKHVLVLSEDIGDRSTYNYKNLLKAQDYIAGKLESYGYKIEFQNYTVEGKDFKNIIAVKTGSESPGQVVLVGAHYDTCFNPGADDNASGVSVMLALAKYFTGKDTKKTLKFVAFVNEEPPFFRTDFTGSSVYVKSAKSNNENIEGALILEMVGYFTDGLFSQKYPPLLGPFLPNRGNFIAVIGNFPSFNLVWKMRSFFKGYAAFPVEAMLFPSWVPGVNYSDNYEFWRNGYPAVMLTDTAFYRNPNYHTDKDVHGTLNYDRMADFVLGLGSFLNQLVGT